jgi:hypothetical protein
MLFIGIDSGLFGAIAFLHDDGQVEVYKTPIIRPARGKGAPQYDEDGMDALLLGAVPINVADWARKIGPPAFAVIESVQAFPKQGLSSAIKIGRGDGLWQGKLGILGVKREVVTPRRWQRVMHSGVPKKDTKLASIVVAKQLWPGISLLPTPKCTKADDGMADALLIAEYARRRHNGRA